MRLHGSVADIAGRADALNSARQDASVLAAAFDVDLLPHAQRRIDRLAHGNQNAVPDPHDDLLHWLRPVIALRDLRTGEAATNGAGPHGLIAACSAADEAAEAHASETADDR